MSDICFMHVTDPQVIKQQFATKLGPALIQEHGKKSNYSPQEVRATIDRLGLPLDFSCWAYALFTSHEDFDRVHEETGEVCDYVAMKTEMLSLVPTKDSSDWFAFDWDLSEIDLSVLMSCDLSDLL